MSDISSAEFWDDYFNGKTNEGRDDSGNPVKPIFDRIDFTERFVEGDKILDVGSAQAVLCKKLKSKNPEKIIIALDHSKVAKEMSGYDPYIVSSVYDMPFKDNEFDLVIATQIMEVIESLDKFMLELKRVAKNGLFTVAIGKMEHWSQCNEFTLDSFNKLLFNYGKVDIIFPTSSLILAKVSFNE
jgi:ubiquinone/menaquinone biosynthesis C-methylase UbiE